MQKDLLEIFNVILVAPHHDGVHTTKIYTYQGTFSSIETVTNIMNRYCIQYGSDLNGRLNATRKRLGIRKSPPVIISEVKEIVALQLPVPYYKEPMWILDLDFEIYPITSKTCEIVFRNGLKLEVQISEEALKERRYKALISLYKFKYAHNRKRLHLRYT